MWDDPLTPVNVLRTWHDSPSNGYKTFGVPLGTAVQCAIALTRLSPRPGFCYTAHSLQIGVYNELAGLGFLEE